MELSMYTLGGLKMMEVIDISTGTKLGFIKDIVIDLASYKIECIVLPTKKMSWFGKNEDIQLPWDRIRKIGADVILVDGTDFVVENKQQ